MNRSLNTPEQLTTTSILGLPNSFKGINSSLLILPTESGFGFTPTNHKICASDSPYV